MAERVATGHLKSAELVGDTNSEGISFIDLALRKCPMGAAACQLTGVECDFFTKPGEVLVTMICGMPSRCLATDESLQEALNRSRVVEPDPKSSKP